MADAEDAEFSDALACTDDHVFGPHSLNGGAATRAANFVIEVDNCWDGAASMLTHAIPDDRQELPSGLYALILYGSFDTDGALGLRLQY